MKDAEAALQLPTNQVLALFNKVSLRQGVGMRLRILGGVLSQGEDWVRVTLIANLHT